MLQCQFAQHALHASRAPTADMLDTHARAQRRCQASQHAHVVMQASLALLSTASVAAAYVTPRLAPSLYPPTLAGQLFADSPELNARTYAEVRALDAVLLAFAAESLARADPSQATAAPLLSMLQAQSQVNSALAYLTGIDAVNATDIDDLHAATNITRRSLQSTLQRAPTGVPASFGRVLLGALPAAVRVVNESAQPTLSKHIDEGLTTGVAAVSVCCSVLASTILAAQVENVAGPDFVQQIAALSAVGVRQFALSARALALGQIDVHAFRCASTR
jgi:hypothetical protein